MSIHQLEYLKFGGPMSVIFVFFGVIRCLLILVFQEELTTELRRIKVPLYGGVWQLLRCILVFINHPNCL